MKGKDQIKDLFSDKLGSFEAPVRPELWVNIASQVGATSAAASTGMSLLVKSIIGVTIAGAAVVTTVLLIKSNSEEKKNDKTIAKTAIVEDAIKLAPIKENQALNQTEIADQKPVIEIITKIQENTPEPNEIVDLDQNQNFKTDVSLISTLKERELTTPNNEKEKKQTPTVAENKTASNTTDQNNKLVKEETPQKEVANTENKEKQVAYSLGELPNIFTPNGDGNNDFLFIESEGLVDFTIVVLDAKQKVMFESNDPNFKWNGLDKTGNTVSEGSYGYYIIARDKNGNKVNKFVTLEVRF